MIVYIKNIFCRILHLLSPIRMDTDKWKGGWNNLYHYAQPAVIICCQTQKHILWQLYNIGRQNADRVSSNVPPYYFIDDESVEENMKVSKKKKWLLINFWCSRLRCNEWCCITQPQQAELQQYMYTDSTTGWPARKVKVLMDLIGLTARANI